MEPLSQSLMIAGAPDFLSSCYGMRCRNNSGGPLWVA